MPLPEILAAASAKEKTKKQKPAKPEKAAPPVDSPKSPKLPKPPTKAKPTAGPAVLTKLQKFEMQTINRSELNEASYNPRFWSDSARAKLRAGMKRHGLVDTLVVNKRTGNTVVGGHFRLSELDKQEGGKNYLLTVQMIDVSEKEEKELNVLLNNQQAAGEWDFTKLESLIRDPALDIEGMGFDGTDVMQMFGASALEEKEEEIQKLADKLREAQESFEKKVAHTAKRDDPDFFLIFRGHPERKTLTEALGVPDRHYVDPKWFLHQLFVAFAEIYDVQGVSGLSTDDVMEKLLNRVPAAKKR